MVIDELHAKKATITVLAGHYGARRIRVFGSVARREERPDSDVDFLVDFPRGYDLFAQRKVELVPEHKLNQHIREQVMNEAVEL